MIARVLMVGTATRNEFRMNRISKSRSGKAVTEDPRIYADSVCHTPTKNHPECHSQIDSIDFLI